MFRTHFREAPEWFQRPLNRGAGSAAHFNAIAPR
jgi:hypothetical protein